LKSEDEFWHELVYCGIGGRTVEEAKSNMSYSEFLDWCKYREYWGPMHFGMRVDKAVARFIYYWIGSKTKERSFSIDSFSPYDKMAKDRKILESPDEFFKKLSEIVKAG
jgi:hypothetical protein